LSTLTKEQQVQLAVAQTLSARPRNTAAPAPPPTRVPPTPTPVRLSGLFCEYQFCIGHPSDMSLYDVTAQQSPGTTSSYGQGILAAFKANTGPFIQVMWQEAPGVSDPQFMLDLITGYGGDTRNGDVQPKLIGQLNVFYVPIAPTASAATTLPFGGAAAWLCEGRAFAWKTYVTQQEIAATLMEDALSRFRCEPR
jgi:hypothetical protein